MGKKAKIGKQRKDKFYFLAKEAGYRSRAAFKLLQLNKRFEFLQRSRALVDLCAAPGGWLQVAEQNMPVSSLRIGVDLVPIKAIKNCITIQGDITEEKTRHAVRKELNNWEADCVLHDGAPNVGTNWGHDAFQQNCLTLSALRLASQVLRRGGYFVTKIFRSADSQTLIGVFEKLFKKVHVWKPAASRLESAEIFVVCEKYAKPDKVDPELLDAKKVFSTQPGDENDKVNLHRLLLHPGRKDKKPKALGYEEDGALGQFRELPASEFIASKNVLQLLSRASALVLDSEKLAQNEHTTPEIRECLQDIKVCGPAEMRRILAWRRKLIEEQKKEERVAAKTGNGENEPKQIEEIEEEEQSQEMKELEEIDELIRNARTDEKSALKKRKKKLLKEKRKQTERKKLHMVHEGDVPTIGEDLELFSLKTVRRLANKARAKALAAAQAAKGEQPLKEEEMDVDSDDENDDYDDYDADNEVKDEEEDGNHSTEMGIESMGGKKNRKTDFKEEEEDSEVDDKDGLSDLDDEEEEDNRDGKGKDGNAKRKRKLTPEQLAMGEQMIYSRKKARELEEWAWNRYTSNDDGLPEWFAEDEKRHCRPTEPPVDRQRVQFYAQREKPLNARTIKKVVEAKMRKKQRKVRRLDKAKRKAEALVDNEQMEHGEKLRELKKLYRKAAVPDKKKVKYQVVTKGKKGSMTRPKGPFKLVDRRLKKDTRALHPKGKARAKGREIGRASCRERVSR